jgi:molecular chaperone GrpE
MEENTNIEEELIESPENVVEADLDQGAEDQPAEELEELDDLSKALGMVEEFKDALQRERADFQNFRKRVDRETDMLKAKTIGDILGKFLPVVDDFERAVGAIPEDEREKDWVAGIGLILRKLQTLLEAEGVQRIDPLGEDFDPNFHEAIGADEPSDEFASGQVTVVLQKGYLKGDRVLRPAIVRVAN